LRKASRYGWQPVTKDYFHVYRFPAGDSLGYVMYSYAICVTCPLLNKCSCRVYFVFRIIALSLSLFTQSTHIERNNTLHIEGSLYQQYMAAKFTQIRRELIINTERKLAPNYRCAACAYCSRNKYQSKRFGSRQEKYLVVQGALLSRRYALAEKMYHQVASLIFVSIKPHSRNNGDNGNFHQRAKCAPECVKRTSDALDLI